MREGTFFRHDRDCLKNNSGFVIALTKTDSEYISSIYDYACYVEIVDWSQLDGGLLGITVEGKKIVKLDNYSLNESNLLIGNAIEINIGVEFDSRQNIKFCLNLSNLFYPEIKAYIFHTNPKYNDANWLGFRLIECFTN